MGVPNSGEKNNFGHFCCCRIGDSKTDTGRHQLYNNGSCLLRFPSHPLTWVWRPCPRPPWAPWAASWPPSAASPPSHGPPSPWTEWTSRLVTMMYSLGRRLRKMFCNMFSRSFTDHWAELQLPCCPSKQGGFPENILQNIFLNLPPQTVWRGKWPHRRGGRWKMSLWEEIYCSLWVVSKQPLRFIMTSDPITMNWLLLGRLSTEVAGILDLRIVYYHARSSPVCESAVQQ